MKGIDFDWRELEEKSDAIGLDSKGRGEERVTSDFIESLYELDSDLAYLAVAYKYSEIYSRDPRTQNGAVLVNQHGEILLGDVNRFPVGIEETEARWNSREKYDLVVHAEEGVILSAAQLGIKTKGTIMYCPWYACDRCARAILRSGVERIIGHSKSMKFYEENNPDKAKGWRVSIEKGFKLFDEAKKPDYSFISESESISNGTQVRIGGKIMIP